jgi:hypothetical protein
MQFVRQIEKMADLAEGIGMNLPYEAGADHSNFQFGLGHCCSVPVVYSIRCWKRASF